jgi:ABC-type multidrug transport system permease subunit
MIMSTMMSVLLMFIIERPVFLREYASKTYGITSYFIAKAVVETPFQFIFPVIYCLMVYFAIGMTRDFDKLVIFTVTCVLDVFCATSFGFFLGCAFNNASVATMMSMLIIMPFMLFAGYYVNLGDVYVWLRWIQYLSPIRYSTEALLRNEFEDNDRYGSYSTIYERFDYNLGLGYCLMMLAIFSVVLRVLALVALRLTVAKVQ